MLLFIIFPHQAKAEYLYKTNKKYFDFELNGEKYQAVGIEDYEYQKKFNTPGVPVVLAVADSQGNMVQNNQIISRCVNVAEIIGYDNSFSEYGQKLKFQRETFEKILNLEIAGNWTERIGIILVPKAAVVAGKAALTGGTLSLKDSKVLMNSILDISKDPDTYFKGLAAEILKDSIKKLQETETKIAQLKKQANYDLTEIESLNRVVEDALAKGYASCEFYKTIMGSPGKSIRKAFESGLKQLISDSTDQTTKMVGKDIFLGKKLEEVLSDCGAYKVFVEKYKEQMKIFQVQKSDKITENKVQRALQLAENIGSLNELTREEEGLDGLFGNKGTKGSESDDDLFLASQKISEKRTQKLKGVGYKTMAKDEKETESTGQRYASNRSLINPLATNLSESKRYDSTGTEKLPLSNLQASLSPSGIYLQQTQVWNQIYDFQQKYSNALLEQNVFTDSLDSYTRALMDAFQRRDWDEFMTVSETMYRSGYFKRWENQLPSDFNQMAELGFGAHHELRKQYNKEEFNWFFDGGTRK